MFLFQCPVVTALLAVPSAVIVAAAVATVRAKLLAQHQMKTIFVIVALVAMVGTSFGIVETGVSVTIGLGRNQKDWQMAEKDPDCKHLYTSLTLLWDNVWHCWDCGELIGEDEDIEDD